MATGPEHYQEAELLLRAIERTCTNHDETNPAAALLIAEAQVRATLALAAATALRGETPRGDGFDDYRTWQDAIGAERSGS